MSGGGGVGKVNSVLSLGRFVLDDGRCTASVAAFSFEGKAVQKPTALGQLDSTSATRRRASSRRSADRAAEN